MRVIGLMSGTSLDGIDAALARFDAAESGVDWRLEAFVSRPYARARRDRIRAALAGDAAVLCRLHADLGEWLATAALEVCSAGGVKPEDVGLIGSHGQTIWHEPPQQGQRGATLQLGCPATIAERTGITVISDFRSRDVAAGGHGAPLVPWVDGLLFAAPEASRVLVNIGGMANLTRVGPRGSDEPLLAFDTGPGNALIDATVELATGGAARFDENGIRAAQGRIREDWLADLLAHPFLSQEPPRSTGREEFGTLFAAECARNWRVADERWDDAIATITAFTARSIADATARWAIPLGVDEVVITGGGASNPVLVRWIADALAPLPVVTGDMVGIDSDAKEAIAFAALAWAHERGRSGNVPGVTGAEGPRVLGSRTPGKT